MTELFYPPDQPTSINGSTGSVVFTAGNNITLSQNQSTITIIGGAGGGGGSFSAGISGGNTSGNTGTVNNQLVLAGGNNITLSGSTNAGGMSVTISGTNQSIQTQNSIQVNGSSGSIVLTAGNNITLSQNASTITISAGSQSVQTQNSVLVNGSSGSIVLTAGNNITLSQNASTITVSAANQTVQTQNLVSIDGSTGSIVFTAGNNITLSQNASTITISAANQTVQTQNNVDISLNGNTSGALALISSGTAILAGGNNVTLSQNGQSVTISAANQTVQTQNLVSVNGSTGNISIVAGANISLSQNASTITISASNQSVQTQNLVDISLSGNTAGVLALVSSGTVIFAGGNNITLSQNGQSITISGPNAGGAQTGISGLQVSNTTYTSGTVTFQNANGISFGSSGANGISASYTVPTQSNQTLSFAATSNTAGNTSGISVDARSITLAGYGIASVGFSTSAGGTSIVVSASSNQTNQTVGVYASSQTVGQSSSSTVDARSFTHVGQGIVSVGLSGGSLLISATTPTQTNQSIGLYASSQTYGQSSSSTVDARSLTVVAQGIISAGLSAGSLLLSASTTQSVQTQNCVDISLSGNTAGVLALISSGTAILAGGNNITLSQNGQSITISGANIGGAQTGISGIQVSNTTYTSGTVTFQNANGISFGSSGANGISASYTVPTQTNQTVGIYASSQTVGQSSSSTYDARSLSFVGQGIISIGESGGSVLFSATTVQSVQSLGLYASSQTYGQSSSSTIDARSLTVVAQGAISAGLSGGSLVLSVSPGAQSNQTLSFAATGNTTGNTSGVSIDARSLTLQGLGIASVGFSTSAGGTSVILSVSQTVQTQNLMTVNGTQGNVTISGGANVTVGNNASTITISVNPQTNQSIGFYASSQTYGQSSSSTVDARSISVVGQGGISAGLSAGSLLISGPNTVAQTNQTLGVYGSSQTTGSASSNTYDARSLSIIGAGIISIGNNSTSAGGTTLGLLISATAPGTGTTFNGANVSGSLTVNTAGLNVSLSVANQTNQSIGMYGSSQTVGQSSSTTVDARSISFVGQGIVSVGASNGSILLSATSNQSVQSIGIYASSQTVGQSSSSTIDARSFTHVGQGIVSVGMSGGSLLISATTPSQTNQTIGVYASSQTVGQSSSSTIDARSLTVVGQGIISAGMSAGSLLISATAGGGGIALAASNTTYTSGTVVLTGGANVTVTTNGQTVSISAANQTNQTLGIYASSQTVGQSSSSTIDARSLSFVGQGVASVGMSAGSVLISVPSGGGGGFTGGFSTLGNTSGNTAMVSNQMVLAGINNVTLSGSTGANSVTISISGPTISTAQLVAAGNTTGTLVTLSSGYLSLAGGNNITLSQDGTNQVITISGVNEMPVGMSNIGNTSGTSAMNTGQLVLIGGNNITLSQSTVAGHSASLTISAGGGTLSKLIWPPYQAAIASITSGITQSSASVQYLPLDQYLSFSRIDIPMYVSMANGASSNASSAYFVFTNFMVIYTRNGSTLNAIVGTSQTQTVGPAFSSGVSLSNVTGYKYLSFPIATLLSPGEYWIGFNVSSSSGFTSAGGATTAVNGTFAPLCLSALISSASGFADFGSSVQASSNILLIGINSTNLSATNQTIQFGNMTVTGASFVRANVPLIFRNY